MAITESAPQIDDVQDGETVAADDSAATEVVDDVLVEEISIDGMCGVY